MTHAKGNSCGRSMRMGGVCNQNHKFTAMHKLTIRRVKRLLYEFFEREAAGTR